MGQGEMMDEKLQPIKPNREALILERRAKVAELYSQRVGQREIAKALGCSLGTVNSDIRALEHEWQATALEGMGALKARELVELDAMEREAALQFARAKREAGEKPADPTWYRERQRIKELRWKLTRLEDADLGVRLGDLRPTAELGDDELEAELRNLDAELKALEMIRAKLNGSAEGNGHTEEGEHGPH